jgi:cell division protein FtsL
VARINALLLLIAVACAVGVVAAQHEWRKLYMALEREQDRTRQLEVEYGQLQLEASTWSSRGRIEKVGRERLQMKPPEPGHILVVELLRKN